MIHSFLLLGQSNMAGRGFFHDVAPITNKRLFVLRNGRWQPMFSPINPDRPFSGVNLAESFADLYAETHQVDTGLIPCADGGTTLDQWQRGSLLYDNAVYQAKLALRTSTIAGILWHQGESDCEERYYPYYKEKLLRIMESLRADLDLHDIPWLLGGLGDYLENAPTDSDGDNWLSRNFRCINETLKEIASSVPMTGFVSAEGLEDNGDNLHFSARALREFGERYFRVFDHLEDKSKVFSEKCCMDDAVRSPLEKL